MPSGFYTWSLTASANGNADSSINWQTGMSPSSVEPSSRAEMARLREFGNDISGSILTTGTSTAYAIATAQNFDTLAHLNGQMIAFVPHTTNGAVVTLNVDALGAKPLRSSPGVELGAGVLVQGSPYVATYNNSDAAFYLHGFYSNAFNTPIGGLMPYLGLTPPNSNFVFPNGQFISRTTYATLFALVGTTFSVGDGLTTFGVPDLMGRTIFGLDGMGGAPALGRITVAGGNFDSTIRGATGGAQNHTLLTTEMPSHTHVATTTVNGNPTFFEGPGVNSGQAGTGANTPTAIGAIALTTSIAATGGGGAFTVLSPAMMLPYILRVI